MTGRPQVTREGSCAPECPDVVRDFRKACRREAQHDDISLDGRHRGIEVKRGKDDGTADVIASLCNLIASLFPCLCHSLCAILEFLDRGAARGAVLCVQLLGDYAVEGVAFGEPITQRFTNPVEQRGSSLGGVC